MPKKIATNKVSAAANRRWRLVASELRVKEIKVRPSVSGRAAPIPAQISSGRQFGWYPARSFGAKVGARDPQRTHRLYGVRAKRGLMAAKRVRIALARRLDILSSPAIAPPGRPRCSSLTPGCPTARQSVTALITV